MSRLVRSLRPSERSLRGGGLPSEEPDFVEGGGHSHKRRETRRAPKCVGGFPDDRRWRQTGLTSRSTLTAAHLAEHPLERPELLRAVAGQELRGLLHMTPAPLVRRQPRCGCVNLLLHAVVKRPACG